MQSSSEGKAKKTAVRATAGPLDRSKVLERAWEGKTIRSGGTVKTERNVTSLANIAKY